MDCNLTQLKTMLLFMHKTAGRWNTLSNEQLVFFTLPKGT